MHKHAQTILMASIALAVTLTGLPASAQQGRFATAPAPVIRSTLADVDMSNIAQNRLPRLVRNIARELGQCQAVRRELERALAAARTAYDVHEDWLSLHHECLSQRQEDLAEIAMAANTIEQVDGDSRPLEKLRTDLDALDGVLQDALAAHDDLTEAYDRTQALVDE